MISTINGDTFSSLSRRKNPFVTTAKIQAENTICKRKCSNKEDYLLFSVTVTSNRLGISKNYLLRPNGIWSQRNLYVTSLKKKTRTRSGLEFTVIKSWIWIPIWSQTGWVVFTLFVGKIDRGWDIPKNKVTFWGSKSQPHQEVSLYGNYSSMK